MNGRIGAWVETYTGKQFWPLDPSPEDVCIEDIAHALSLICRFNGHCKHFYSVAYHSILCAELAVLKRCDTRVKLLALLHDAAEAYSADIMRPLKPFLNGYLEMEERIQNAIYEGLGINKPSPEEEAIVYELDTTLLATEGSALMPFKNWGGLPYPAENRIVIGEVKPATIEHLFKARYKIYFKAFMSKEKNNGVINNVGHDFKRPEANG